MYTKKTEQFVTKNTFLNGHLQYIISYNVLILIMCPILLGVIILFINAIEKSNVNLWCTSYKLTNAYSVTTQKENYGNNMSFNVALSEVMQQHYALIVTLKMERLNHHAQVEVVVGIP
ncbi:uncharacterized protein LOC143429267 [Xylocopa sonorina]|uniref:uncharacterized protein LOC143429267 n=1 Tax=Xylocopa sonorina TaxID=1818115 RepID=UPI00403B387B